MNRLKTITAIAALALAGCGEAASKETHSIDTYMQCFTYLFSRGDTRAIEFEKMMNRKFTQQELQLAANRQLHDTLEGIDYTNPQAFLNRIKASCTKIGY